MKSLVPLNKLEFFGTDYKIYFLMNDNAIVLIIITTIISEVVIPSLASIILELLYTYYTLGLQVPYSQ